MTDLLHRYQADLGLAQAADITVRPVSEGVLSSTLPVAALAVGAVAALGSAVDRFRVASGLTAPSPHVVVGDRVAASFAGDRLLRIDGRPVAGFAALSGFFRTADGWVRTHANYPHHRARLLSLLELADDSDHTAVAAALLRREALDVEERAAELGALVVAVRTPDEWFGSAPGRFTRSGPIVSSTVRPDGLPSLPEPPTDPMRPLAGVRVLDLTRVIAGPVATRDLALLGASVLRVDSPLLPEIEAQHLDTGAGKYSTLLDVLVDDDDERLTALMSSVDVVVGGYRPGSYIDDHLRAHRPSGAIIGTVSAWGGRGPWARRRGFDSLAQAASGIANMCGGKAGGRSDDGGKAGGRSDDGGKAGGRSDDGGTTGVPGALPVQALDHASGHLLAAGIVDALTQRLDGGIGRTVSVSLARTAAWLLDADGRVDTPADPVLPTDEHTVLHDDVRTARPALAEYDDHPFPARPWGCDEPRFPS
ncbi:CoA transferase [Rhodococcus sp. SORGH_AS_0301]|uniref:CoA transferase n=1 Tax=Rhodococcus sp. SORGH_AS_0301 TaxID=3041780 RepID=UPI00277F1898|nr:CoA transferase [Rhodococcus sp. SORGH_AS_0301]MDQ1180391.1 crotonobetainyl-CoA:carnitine CoA-transferase CaiB-like acyl-CoA transferase [Rhodococcus sp. SORGH_AS_0301]